MKEKKRERPAKEGTKESFSLCECGQTSQESAGCFFLSHRLDSLSLSPLSNRHQTSFSQPTDFLHSLPSLLPSSSCKTDARLLPKSTHSLIPPSKIALTRSGAQQSKTDTFQQGLSITVAKHKKKLSTSLIHVSHSQLKALPPQQSSNDPYPTPQPPHYWQFPPSATFP